MKVNRFNFRLFTAILNYFPFCLPPFNFFCKIKKLAFYLFFFFFAKILNFFIKSCFFGLFVSFKYCWGNIRTNWKNHLNWFSPILTIFLNFVFIWKFSRSPNIFRNGFHWFRQTKQFLLKFWVEISTFFLENRAYELFNNFLLVNFHVNNTLSKFTWKLIFLDLLNNVMNSCSTLLLYVINQLPLLKTMETSHDCRLYETHSSINIVIFKLWD